MRLSYTALKTFQQCRRANEYPFRSSPLRMCVHLFPPRWFGIRLVFGDPG